MFYVCLPPAEWANVNAGQKATVKINGAPAQFWREGDRLACQHPGQPVEYTTLIEAQEEGGLVRIIGQHDDMPAPTIFR